MPKIIIDNQEIECREGVPVLQAAIDAGWDVPHYCYHPSLSVVASCRLCLMEMKMPHPKTREMGWAPKLIPSCQTPVREGMEVRFNSDVVKKNQEACMEFFLLNHPLDCPVCDQAGECYLQDYSYKFGHAESRMVDQKLVNPKKDIGPKTLLYSDRCVMCSRCVRFTQEISGTHELCVVNRGSRSEIDVFPGLPLDNPLQGNVVDICPVGCLLDKDFLFKRRVWELSGTPSVCPGCATGCSIRIDHADNNVYRLKPRCNPDVNDFWMCDEGRFGWKYIEDKHRITAPLVRRGRDESTPAWDALPEILRFRFTQYAQENGGSKIAAMLSPFLACEEAWLLVKFIRETAPDAALTIGPAPYEGDDQQFPSCAVGEAVKFTILKEKCPNRHGIELLLDSVGGSVITYEEFVARCGSGDIGAAWITGGYPKNWAEKDLVKAAGKLELLVVQELLESDLSAAATVLMPACSWAEREGSFVNASGMVQPFARAIDPPDGAKRDGQYLFEVAGFSGLYSGERVRELMAQSLPSITKVSHAAAKPVHAH